MRPSAPVKDPAFTWDIVVRLTHWIIAAGCILNFFILRPGSNVHQITGYVIFIAIIVRLVWAAVGSRYPARLRDMVPTPAGIKAHIAELKAGKHESNAHNAIGLLFIWAAWLLIIAIVITGYLASITEDSGSILGYSAGIENLAYNYNFGDIHEALATILEVLAFIHVAAVFITGWLTKHNYLRPMIHRTGKQEPPRRG